MDTPAMSLACSAHEPCLGLDDMNRQLVLAPIERITADSETTAPYGNHREQDATRGVDHHLALS